MLAMSIGWSLLIVFVVAYSILGWSLYFMQPAFLYHPVREVNYNPGDIGLAYEKIAFKSSDSLKLSGWWVPAEKARHTILFCHGNGGNIAHRLDSINIFNELGLNCFIFDYRGYGNSQGKPSEEGTYLDARAAYQWVTETRGIRPENVILFGRSLGGAVAANLAAQVQARGLILESTFTSYPDMGSKFYPYMPVRLFAAFSYKTIDSVRNINVPLLVIHSRTDELVPFEFGLRLYDAANEPKEFLEIFGCHNDGFLFTGDAYTQGLSAWLEALEEARAQSPRIHRIPSA